jgi:hypothetical protein
MASLYDYGLPQLNQNLMNMYSMVQQEKKNKMLENAQNIENTAAMFKLANDMKQQQMLDKDVLFSGFLEAKGASPNVIQKTNQYLQSLGYMDEVGRIKARNIPAAIQTMNQDPQFQLAILQENWNDAGQKMVALDEEINKLKEKNDPQKQQELADKIMQREKLKVAQFNYKNMMNKLTGVKQDTAKTEAEILSEGGKPAELLVKYKKELAGLDTNTQLIGHTPDGKPVIFDPKARMQTVDGMPYTGRVMPRSEAYPKETKAPSGYKWTGTGDLEPIPGGPADIKFQTEYAKNYGRLSELESGLDRLKSTAEQLKKHPGLYRITGLYGKIPNIPGSEAANAEALLNTMQAQIGFNVLQNMREMSKTGGALGQVSDLENKKLDRALVALDKTQSPQAFQAALDEIIKYADGGKERLRNAFEKNYSTQRQSKTKRPLSFFDRDE